MIQDKIFFDEKDPTGLSYNTPFTYYGSYQGRLWSKSPSGSIQYYTQNSDLSAYATTGSNQFSGSQTVTGSLTVTGTITGTVAGTTATASYVEYANVANKPALISGSAQISFNGITDKPTLVSGSSQVTYSGLSGIPSGIISGSAQIASFGIFATTGSNGFNGSQSITGSLTVTGQVVAQTLNVQQVTSSIVYSSGSNVFGNSLSNTQQFTGSLQVSGSSHYVLGNVGIGTSSPQANLQVLGTIKVATGNAQGILGLGEGNGSTVNVGLWRGAANAPTTDGNFLNLGGYDGIVFATGNAAIGSQTTRLTLSSTGAATFSSTVTATQYTATSTGGSGLRIYGASGTNQWDIYLNGANIRFSDNTGTGSFVVDRPATFSSSVSATTLTLSTTTADYAATITNVQDSSQGLLVRATDNDSSLYLLNLQSSNTATGQTWVDRFTVAKNGAATFSSTVTATRGFFSSNAASDSTTALLANASTNDSSTYAALFGSLNAGYRMVVRADGNVGIGINSPTVLLNIERSVSGTGLGDGMLFKMKNTSTTTNTRSGINFGNIDGIGGSLAMQSAILKNAATGEYDMTWDFYGGAAGWQEGILYIDSNPGRIGIGTQSPITRLSLRNYGGSRLPYINGTNNTFDDQGITVASANSGNAAIGGGLDLTNNTYSVNAYSPIISFSSLTSNGVYNNSYAGIWGVLGGPGGDANWVVGALVFGTASSYGINERVRITSDGRVGIGVTNPEAGLQVALPGADDQLILGSAANNRDHAAFIYSGSNKAEFLRYQSASRLIIGSSANISNLDVLPGGSVGVRLSAGNTSWSAFTSDERKKKNFEAVPGLEAIIQINPVKYHFKTQEDSETKKLGFIAQNLQPLIPEMVHPNGEKAEDGSDILTIIPDYILPVLVKAIQELKAENDTLKSRIDTLEQA